MDEEALLNGGNKNLFCCHPKRTPFRLLMLFVIAMICFGSYFSVDEIQNLGPLWTNTASKYVRVLAVGAVFRCFCSFHNFASFLTSSLLPFPSVGIVSLPLALL